jgi:peptidoglycan-synthase activator LpoB
MNQRLSTILCSILSIGAAGAMSGCHHDKPHEYGKARPPIDEIDSGGRGLQSKDVVQASDQMAMDLLRDPNLNASKEQWTVVVDRVDNRTSDPRANLDIFLQRLRTKLFQEGHGRVQLIENRAKLRELQLRELEPNSSEREDTYGQGAGGNHAAPGKAGIQPDYSLYATMSDLPNRGTDYYYCEFTLTNLNNRTIAWTGAYEVKVPR